MISMLLLQLALGEDAPPMKVMFFGDSVISGVHNSDTDVCPFRYDFLRLLSKREKEVVVVGTNTDEKGMCQKIGEELSLKNNGYQNAMISDLLDFITADLQYLYDPVDYIFSSVGVQDCLTWEEGRDLQILSQSVRRIMGRLLHLNENAKIYHVPVLLPPSASKVAVECMNFVNQKLRDVYDPEKNHGRITVVDPANGKPLTDDMFFKIGEKKKAAPVAPVVSKPAAANPPPVPVATPQKPEVKAPEKQEPAVQPVKTAGSASEPAGDKPQPVPVPDKVQPAPSPQDKKEETVQNEEKGEATSEDKSSESTKQDEPVEPKESGDKRRLTQELQYLPSAKLNKMIADVLIKSMDWNFRAQTPTPTMEVTKEPEYYGYDWCMKNYETPECFEYYYGYVWCLQEYNEDECYNYYYGDVEAWEDDDNFKWCLNFYDEEYCSFAYLGEQPDTWDWLSFGYHDCLKDKESDECFEQYYGYAWCVNEYTDSECYEYYYGGDEWVWDVESSYKWCLNFYTEDDCQGRYNDGSGVITAAKVQSATGISPMNMGILAVLIFGCAVWFGYKKMNCFANKQYSRLDTRYAGGEDEVELL